MREMILNLHKNKTGEKKSQNIRKKMMKCNGKVKSSGKIKRQKGKRMLEEMKRLGKV